MPLRPCMTCGTPTQTSHCPPHRRDRNLATKHLKHLPPNPHCIICNQPITEPRGRTSGAPSIEHLDGNPSNNHPTNRAYAHYGCNSSQAGYRTNT